MATKNKPNTLCNIESREQDKKFNACRLQNDVLSTAAPSPIPNSILKAHIYLELEKLNNELEEINAKIRIQNDLLAVKKSRMQGWSRSSIVPNYLKQKNLLKLFIA